MPSRVPKSLRTAGFILVALSFPIVPFLVFGDWMEEAAASWLQDVTSTGTIAAAVLALLASDIFLPIPSSVVSTYAGTELGIAVGTFISWLGMTIGAAIGYATASAFGKPWAERLARQSELQDAQSLTSSAGIWLVVLTRALPILAEAAVLVCGFNRIGFWRFFVAAAAANLGIAFAYSALGSVAGDHHWLPMALAIAAALPLIATMLVRRRL